MASDTLFVILKGSYFGTLSTDYIICNKFTVNSSSCCNTFVVHIYEVKGKEVCMTSAEVAGKSADCGQACDDEEWGTLTTYTNLSKHSEGSQPM